MARTVNLRDERAFRCQEGGAFNHGGQVATYLLMMRALSRGQHRQFPHPNFTKVGGFVVPWLGSDCTFKVLGIVSASGTSKANQPAWVVPGNCLSSNPCPTAPAKGPTTLNVLPAALVR